MKRSAPLRNDLPSTNHQNLAASTAQRDTDVAEEGSAVGSTDQENDHHSATEDSDQTGSMPFPGPYAYALLPTAASQAGLAEVPAALNMPVTTYASSTATTSSASAEAMPSNAVPEAPQNAQKGNPDALPPLLLAARLGDLDQLRMLLAQPGTDVMQAHVDGLTALHIAARAGHVAIIECLINKGADRTLIYSGHKSCLSVATHHGRANVVEYLLGLGGPMPNPRPRLSPNAEHFDCLSDLYLDWPTPPPSVNNPLHLRDPGLLDHGNQFLVKLTDINTQICQNPIPEIARYLDYTGILNAVIAPLMRGLGEFNDVRNVLAPEVKSLARQQLLVYCASTVSRLAVLAPNQQIAALYLKAGLSEAGVARFSMLGIAQRDQLVALAEEFVAQHASNVLDQLMPACLAKTGFDFQLDAKALRTTLIDAGFIPMLAAMLATCWSATLQQVASMPAAVLQMDSIGEMMAFIRKRVEAHGSNIFAREILRQLDEPGLLRQWRATLGESKAEGLFFLFDDQCRQLRQYAAQMGGRGE